MSRRCLKIDDVPGGEGFFRQTRRFDAEILCVFQVKSTTYGGKRPAVWACWQFSNEPQEIFYFRRNSFILKIVDVVAAVQLDELRIRTFCRKSGLDGPPILL